MIQLPTDLTLRLEKIFTKQEIKDLKDTFWLEKRPTTFRINTIKWNVEEIEGELEKNKISYTKLDFPENCYVIPSPHPSPKERGSRTVSESDLWKLICYTSGRIYIQGISSQIPPTLFSGENPSKILDATAAPWGKTSHLSALYPDAQIYAFEPSKIRYDKMCHNLKKLWCSNVETIYDSIENIEKHIDAMSSWTWFRIFPGGDNVSKTDPATSAGWQEKECFFDMILIDAPCSSEWSLLYNNTKFLENWDISHIKKNYKRQKRICDSLIPYLKKWWEMIYSTCTLSPEENEWVIHYLLCNYPELELGKIELPDTPEVITKNPLITFERYSYKKEISENCVRIIPSRYSEGFFIAKLIKKEA